MIIPNEMIPAVPGPRGPAGQNGTNGTNGTNGQPGPPMTPGNPVALSTLPAIGAAVQAVDPTKGAFLAVSVQAAMSVTIAGTVADEIELRIGPDATVSTGGGTRVASTRESLTGILATVGMGTSARVQLSTLLPAGWYYALRRIGTGSGMTISAVTLTPLG